MHYSVDIILAVFVTASLWQILCQSSALAELGGDQRGLSLLARFWISFCSWFNSSFVCCHSVITQDNGCSRTCNLCVHHGVDHSPGKGPEGIQMEEPLVLRISHCIRGVLDRHMDRDHSNQE